LTAFDLYKQNRQEIHIILGWQRHEGFGMLCHHSEFEHFEQLCGF